MGNPTELSLQLASLVAAAGPRVVRINGRRRRPSSGVFWSSDVIVTAHHTVERDEDVEVVPADGGPLAARVIGRDSGTDLAALKLSSPSDSGATWDGRGGAQPAPGHLVLGVARPGRSLRATLGIVSRVAGSWRSPQGGRLDAFLETDLAMHPGFSGSALVDLSGRLIGVNTSGILRGVSLAVPAPTVRRVLEALVARGALRKGYLGVSTYPVALPRDLETAAGQPHGLMVLSVQPESPASRAGLLLGDVIVSLAGEPIQSAGDLVPLLDEERIGAQAAVRVVRAGALEERTITIGDRGAAGSGDPT